MATEAKGMRVNLNGTVTDVQFKDETARNTLSQQQEAINKNTTDITALNNSLIKKLTKTYTTSSGGNIMTGIPITTQCVAVFPTKDTGDNTLFFQLHLGNMNQWLVLAYYMQNNNIHIASNYTIELNILYL